ncbi:MAG: type II secretion system F family protein, partial [Gemmataceae bacterium]
LFLLVRFLADAHDRRVRERLTTPAEEQSGVLVRRMEQQRQLNAASRMDRSFDIMIARTGLAVTPTQALGFILLAAMGLGGLFFVVRDEPWLIILGFVVGAAAVIGVYLYLQARYRRTLQDQLPETIFLISSSLRAGQSLPQAITSVSEHGAQPIAKEFSRCTTQITLGLSPAAAVENMAERLNLLDLNILASTLAMYQNTGGNLPLLLDRLGQSIRDRNNFRGYLRSATSLGRVTAFFFIGFVPAMLIGYALFQPEHVASFFTSATGWTLLGIAFGLQLIGGLIIYRILKIEF